MRVLQGRAAEAAVKHLEKRRAEADPAAECVSRKIVQEVRCGGDSALRSYAMRFDGLGARDPLSVSPRELKDALERVSPGFVRALETAAANIRRFCEWQMPAEFSREMIPGLRVGQLVRPLESVGCYVPGGRYPLPSSLLMTVIPAQVAGVKRIAVASPRPVPETMAAATLLGITEFYRFGGAQAIAAFAYSSKTVPCVAKIVGPGNRYVTAAKKVVAFDCPIDMLAGPTEVLIVAERGDPKYIAADLVAQAEHDPEALAVFITTECALAERVLREARIAAAENVIAKASLQHAVALVAPDSAVAIAWANRISPEHITVPAEMVSQVTAAGSVFVGDYAPQAVGDYASGPNHVLPTGGSARFRGGLSVYDFLKIITVQQASPEGLAGIAPTVLKLAVAEGLRAHAASVRVRCANA